MMKRYLFICTLILLVLPSLTSASSHITWVREFDPAMNEFTEGIATDRQGNIYVSMLFLGQVRKIAPDGTETVLHEFPGAFVVGLQTDLGGNVYACVFSPWDPDMQGPWRINHQGEATQIPGMANNCNAIAFDWQGTMYVTESNVPGSDPPAGAIWRMPRGGELELWLSDSELLGGLGMIPNRDPIGANGIVVGYDGIYVDNTEKGLIVHVPVLPDGSPGALNLVAGGGGPLSDLYLIDDLALDVNGMIYAAIIGQNRVVAVDPISGVVTDLADEDDGLSGPASMSFGKVRGERKAIFITNSGWPFGPEAAPGVLRLQVGVPGLP
ncbi:MAG: hypothetical protein GY943_22710 [Chloroflexi bacterium]|nr:hypothetical protein [Chloroflexota bacterium]